MKLRGIALVALFALLAPALAQEAKKEEKATPENRVTKIFEVKYQDVNRLAMLLNPFGARLNASPQMKAITVTGPPDVVTAVGEAINRFDVPLKNVELTAYLLVGMTQASQQEAVPKELEGVIKQLRSLFTYQGFRLMDTMVLRSREGLPAGAKGVGPAPPGFDGSAIYTVNYSSVGLVTDAKGNVLRINDLRLDVRLPIVTPKPSLQTTLPSKEFANSALSADIDVREGQKVVVGKTGMGSDALILVVTAKVVE